MTAIAVGLAWSGPAAAQRQRDWAISVSPQVGYVWADARFEGTLAEPDRFTEVATDGDVRGLALGFAAAVTHRFWSRDGRSAIGPILGFHYGVASRAATTLEVGDNDSHALAESLEDELHARLTRGGVEGGIGLTTLQGLLDVRLLVGGEWLSVVAPAFDASTSQSVPTFGATLGARLRLPVGEGWLALVGAQCGRAKYLATSGGATGCAGELGVEWVVGR